MEAGDAGVVDVGSDSVLGCLLSLLLSIVLSLLAGLIVWCVVEAGGAVIVGVFFALSWIMYRALRVVFSRSRECRGQLLKSAGYAALYTVLYVGWLCIVLHVMGRTRG